jgi:hypothetical protein
MCMGSGGGEFKYDMLDTLEELLQMLQCTPTQHNKCLSSTALTQIHESLNHILVVTFIKFNCNNNVCCTFDIYINS